MVDLNVELANLARNWLNLWQNRPIRPTFAELAPDRVNIAGGFGISNHNRPNSMHIISFGQRRHRIGHYRTDPCKAMDPATRTAVMSGQYDLLVLQDQSEMVEDATADVREFYAPQAIKHGASIGFYETWATPGADGKNLTGARRCVWVCGAHTATHIYDAYATFLNRRSVEGPISPVASIFALIRASSEHFGATLRWTRAMGLGSAPDASTRWSPQIDLLQNFQDSRAAALPRSCRISPRHRDLRLECVQLQGSLGKAAEGDQRPRTPKRVGHPAPRSHSSGWDDARAC